MNNAISLHVRWLVYVIKLHMRGTQSLPVSVEDGQKGTPVIPILAPRDPIQFLLRSPPSKHESGRKGYPLNR